MDNSSRKKIVIVGGGITGCILGFYLSQKYQVSIYEARSYLGGIMHDYEHNNKLYFKGCQYLNTENFWFNKFYKVFKKNLRIFEHTYGSYTQFNDRIIISKNLGIPIFNNFYQKNYNFKKKSFSSSSDRFSFYPKIEKKNMLGYLKKFSLDPKLVDFDGITGLQLSRISYSGEDEKIIKIKKENNIYDQILAVKRKKIFKKKLLACLPKKSFQKLYQDIYEYFIKNKNIDIFLKESVDPQWINNNKLYIFDKNKKKINADYIIWTGNPTKLVYNLNKKKLLSFRTVITQLNLDIKNIKKIKDHYVQIFSLKTPITKIYLYNLDYKPKISIEASGKNLNINKIISDSKKILKSFKIKINFDQSNLNVKKDVRYNVISIKDKKTLNQFTKMTKNSNLINCDWSIYGRDQKIDSFFENLKIKKLFSI